MLFYSDELHSCFDPSDVRLSGANIVGARPIISLSSLINCKLSDKIDKTSTDIGNKMYVDAYISQHPTACNLSKQIKAIIASKTINLVVQNTLKL